MFSFTWFWLWVLSVTEKQSNINKVTRPGELIPFDRPQNFQTEDQWLMHKQVRMYGYFFSSAVMSIKTIKNKCISGETNNPKSISKVAYKLEVYALIYKTREVTKFSTLIKFMMSLNLDNDYDKFSSDSSKNGIIFGMLIFQSYLLFPVLPETFHSRSLRALSNELISSIC